MLIRPARQAKTVLWLMPSPRDLAIVPFRPELREAFERLNRRWLEDHGLLEPVDLEYLKDPEGHVLASGGQVLFALRDGEVVGTCAILRLSPSTVELAKLAVSPDAQGMGLGRRLCVEALAFARELGAQEVVLTSNSALVAAIGLYESLGFRHEPMPPGVRYASADVFMVLQLGTGRPGSGG